MERSGSEHVQVTKVLVVNGPVSEQAYFSNGCVPLPEWTGMDNTGMDFRNRHYALALGALMYFICIKCTSGLI